MVHHRHHQAAIGLSRDTKMNAAVPANDLRVVIKARVHLREFFERTDQRKRNKRQYVQFWLFGFPIAV